MATTATPVNTSSQKIGTLLARAVVSWTENQDAANDIDFLSGFAPQSGEDVILAIRNGSADIDLTARYGSLRRLTMLSPIPESVACTVQTTADTITKAAHGLVVGDAVTFTDTANGITLGVTYYVVAVTTNTFQIATAREGSALTISSSGSNTYSLAWEHMARSTFVVEKFTAGSSTALVGGLEETVVAGVAFPFRVTLTKSAATASAFSAYVELRRA